MFIPPDSDDAALNGSSCYGLSNHDYLEEAHIWFYASSS